MKLETGMLAKSLAGHDRGRIYVIVRAGEEYAYVADGVLKPLRRPKKKNRRHLQPILRMRLEEPLSDGAVRERIEAYTRSGEMV